MIKITGDELKVITNYIYELSGIFVDNSKTYLIETRLANLLKELGCKSYSEFYFKLKTDTDRTLSRKVIDAITTGETQFFRDTYPFELLRHKIVPDLIDQKRARSSGLLPVSIRIWSAGCSTGQEVYSIAIVLKELLPDLKQYDIKIMGTDISDAAIARAAYGQYNKLEIQRGLSENKLRKYFNFTGNKWKIKDEIRAMVTFSKRNLMEPFRGLGKFDIILCRNVAIYFKHEDRSILFDRIAGVLEADGCLVIGSTESLTSVSKRFEAKRYLRSVFYQLKVQ